jgi:hypothetical protein
VIQNFSATLRIFASLRETHSLWSQVSRKDAKIRKVAEACLLGSLGKITHHGSRYTHAQLQNHNPI